MSPADVVLDLLFSTVTWLAAALPRIPAAWVNTVNKVVTDAASLVSGVPYSNLVPWSTIGAIGAGLPVVLAVALAVRLISRVWAWVRSRGTADQ